jgi:hypothetical protein
MALTYTYIALSSISTTPYYRLTGGGCTIGSNVIIPDFYDDGINGSLPVKQIGQFVFINCSVITSVITGDNLIDIQRGCFAGATNLRFVQFGKKFSRIGFRSFENNSNNLVIIFFGNAPTVYDALNNPSSIGGIGNSTCYRIGGTKGWGIENTFQGRPLFYYYKNLIKAGGTGKLTTKKRN